MVARESQYPFHGPDSALGRLIVERDWTASPLGGIADWPAPLLDAVSMMLLMVPLYSLYEFAILAIRITHWRAARKAARSGSAVVGPQTEEGPEAPPGGGEGWRFRAHLSG